MNRFTRAAVSPSGSGIVSHAFGRRVLRVTAAETGGIMGAWDEPVPPGEGPPLHMHTREDELFRVLEGHFRFWCGGDVHDLGPDGVIVMPRDVPHRFQNLSEKEGRLLIAVTPGGFEQFFLDVERGHADTPEAISVLAMRYGLAFLPPEGQAAT